MVLILEEFYDKDFERIEYYSLYCSRQSEWDDIKTIMFWAFENYDLMSLDYLLPKLTGQKSDPDKKERLGVLCERLKGMTEEETVYLYELLSIQAVRKQMVNLDFAQEVGISKWRLTYLERELNMLTEYEVKLEQAQLERKPLRKGTAGMVVIQELDRNEETGLYDRYSISGLEQSDWDDIKKITNHELQNYKKFTDLVSRVNDMDTPPKEMNGQDFSAIRFAVCHSENEDIQEVSHEQHAQLTRALYSSYDPKETNYLDNPNHEGNPLLRPFIDVLRHTGANMVGPNSAKGKAMIERRKKRVNERKAQEKGVQK